MSYQNGADTAAASTPMPARLGRYELIGQLATGGMAEIHLAKLAGEAGFEKIVVVKRLLPELVASKQYVAMFLDEAKLVARLDHPNVCEVFELARDGAEYFLVMPFLDGVPATELIARPRDPDRIAQLRVVAGIVAQAAAGLHHAHELRDATGAVLGLVHRDVSPSNLFVTASGTVKVLDFGIAKIPGAADTEAGTIKGKTQYMAPEQLLGEPLDRRADVFALGIVLYELATHQRLFKRASDYLAARAILEEPIPRADAADPALPAALSDVIARALARAPADRFATARELGAALEAAFAPHGGIATPAEIAASLAERNADELSAQRTRQQRIVADAAARAISATGVTDAARAIAATGVTDAARETAATDVATAPRMLAPITSHRRRKLVIGGALLVAASATALVLAWPRDRTPELASSSGSSAEIGLPPSVPVDTSAADDRRPDAGVIAEQHEPTKSAGTKHTPTKAAAATTAVATKAAAATTAVATGWYTIDSKPFATIFIDDAEVGMTPLIHKPLALGPHRVRAVLRDGRQRTFMLRVRAGKPEPVNLTW